MRPIIKRITTIDGGDPAEYSFVLGRHHLVVLVYNFEVIRRTLVRLVERYSGATWQDVAAKVSRIGYWEFEDYAQADKTG
jgi:hypothetical protein